MYIVTEGAAAADDADVDTGYRPRPTARVTSLSGKDDVIQHCDVYGKWSICMTYCFPKNPSRARAPRVTTRGWNVAGGMDGSGSDVVGRAMEAYIVAFIMLVYVVPWHWQSAAL